MEDRYLFKAKRVDDGEWIVGSLIQTPYLGSMRSWISSEQEDKARLREISSNQAVWRAFEVRTDTICQCTGLKDKNGKLIWENDICNYYNSEDKDGIGIIKNDYVLWIDGTISMRHKMTPLFYLQCKDEWKVIGNIFDNPELLESEG